MRKIKILLVLILLTGFVGCAVMQELGITIKPYAKMTPKEKVTFLFKAYNKQYDDYLEQAAKPNLTEVDRQMLRSRKKVMIEVYPLIGMLDAALVEGKPFDASIEKLIINKLRQLGSKIE